jgi:lipoic acid synthetase
VVLFQRYLTGMALAWLTRSPAMGSGAPGRLVVAPGATIPLTETGRMMRAPRERGISSILMVTGPNSLGRFLEPNHLSVTRSTGIDDPCGGIANASTLQQGPCAIQRSGEGRAGGGAITIKGMTPPSAVMNPELVQIDLSPRGPVRKPEWLKAKAPMGETFHALKKMARELNLHTVCESAQCPNIGECWNQKSATFMMLGNLCTRRCGFCAVPKGKPEPIDFDEPRRVAYAVAQLGLAHAVVTSVNRDDDNLGAARAFVSVIEEIRLQAPACRVEVLTPDFQGHEAALRLVVAARPEILNHNIETVPRLYRVAKSGGKYLRSLRFLEQAKEIAAELFSDRAGDQIVTKTGIIVGMGEEMHELLAVFRDLADRKVDILTIGQYLRPSKDHLTMARYYTPEEFAFLKHEALAMGFRHVESGPLVRSSYHAQEQAESTGLA